LRSSQSQGYSEDYSDADALQKLAQGANVALLVVTHTRKAPADDFLDEISGTLGLSGGADAGLVLRRERGRADAMLVGSGRDLEHDVDLALTWDTTLTSWTIAGSATDYRRSAEQQAIYDILAEMREPATAKDVADILGKTYGAARFLLWKMAHAGTLDVRGGKYTIREAAGDAI
jgi:hypothetical protein